MHASIPHRTGAVETASAVVSIVEIMKIHIMTFVK